MENLQCIHHTLPDSKRSTIIISISYNNDVSVPPVTFVYASTIIPLIWSREQHQHQIMSIIRNDQSLKKSPVDCTEPMLAVETLHTFLLSVVDTLFNSPTTTTTTTPAVVHFLSNLLTCSPNNNKAIIEEELSNFDFISLNTQINYACFDACLKIHTILQRIANHYEPNYVDDDDDDDEQCELLISSPLKQLPTFTKASFCVESEEVGE
jgi:hypothetical protein